MRFSFVVLGVLFVCGFAWPTAAADRGPVDLAALLDELDRASPELLALRARADAAATVPLQREALPDPKLAVLYTNDGVKDFTLGSSEFTNLAVGWEQEVPYRSVRDRAAAVAEADAETLRASTRTAGARLRAKVITLYAELWRLDHTGALLDESRALLASAVEAVQARYESGEGIQEGLIRAQGALSRVDLAVEELSLARRKTEIALAAALGRPGDPEFGPARELPEIAGAIDGEQLAAAAASASPELLESLQKERVAEALLDEARAQLKPTFAWLASYQFRAGLDPMVMGGFTVRLPVWKDKKQARAIAGAELARSAAEHDRKGSELRARAEARELVADIASIDSRLRVYREAIVPRAEAAFASANAAFASGRAEMFLVLDDLSAWIADRREALTLSAEKIAAVASLEATTATALFDVPRPGRSQ